MTRTQATLVAGAAALALAAIGLGVTGGADDDADERARGPAAGRAGAAAAAIVPGGTVTGVERGEGDGAVWEAELRRPDGSTVEVRLRADLRPAGPITVEEDGND